MDISKFFDRVNWDILMGKIAPVIRDKRVLKLIGRYLRAGAMLKGVVVQSGRHAARRAVIAAAGQHLPGRSGSRTGEARATVQPVRG
jgi:hypothetical protein